MSHANVLSLLKKADDLKDNVSDLFDGKQDAWVPWQDLLDIYRKIVLTDLEFALDRKVEQDLWNFVFKNQISLIQSKARDKSRSSTKRNESAYCLTVFLEIAAGFYLEFFQQICSAFKLNLPMRQSTESLGILKELSSPIKSKQPKKSSCLYICQYCLVHLGDIARYRQEEAESKSYYRHAIRLVPGNGQPYNQLAILASAKSRKLGAVFYYVRSLAVRHPFPSAKTNLEKLLNKTVDEELDLKGKLSTSEMASVFLQHQASIYFRAGLERLRNLSVKFLTSLHQHLSSQYLAPIEMIQYIVVSLYVFENVRSAPKIEDPLGVDSEVLQETLLGFLISLLEHFLQCTPKQDTRCRTALTLPAVKVLLDWFTTEPAFLKTQKMKISPVWPHLAKLLTHIQTDEGELPGRCKKFVRAPLPEDIELQGLLYLDAVYCDLDYQTINCSKISNDDEVSLRSHRLLKLGKRIADMDLGSGDKLLAYQELESGRVHFSCPGTRVKIGPTVEVIERRVESVSPEAEPIAQQPPRRREGRTNVAIQTIMQNKAALAASQEPEQHQQPPPPPPSNYDLTASYAGRQLKFTPRDSPRYNGGGAKKPPNLPPRLERLQKSLGRSRSPEEDPLSVSWPRAMRGNYPPPWYWKGPPPDRNDDVGFSEHFGEFTRRGPGPPDWHPQNPQQVDVRYMMSQMQQYPPPPGGMGYPPPSMRPPYRGGPAMGQPYPFQPPPPRFQRPLPPPPGVFMVGHEQEMSQGNITAGTPRDHAPTATYFEGSSPVQPYESPINSSAFETPRVPTSVELEAEPVKLFLPGPGNDDKWRFDPKTDTPKSEKGGDEEGQFELFPDTSPEWPAEYGPSPITESAAGDSNPNRSRILTDDVLKSIWTAPDGFDRNADEPNG